MVLMMAYTPECAHFIISAEERWRSVRWSVGEWAAEGVVGGCGAGRRYIRAFAEDDGPCRSARPVRNRRFICSVSGVGGDCGGRSG